jgi:hypothetical protein
LELASWTASSSMGVTGFPADSCARRPARFQTAAREGSHAPRTRTGVTSSSSAKRWEVKDGARRGLNALWRLPHAFTPRRLYQESCPARRASRPKVGRGRGTTDRKRDAAMADDANEQTTPHWGTSAPDYEGEDPENEIELDPNMAELPLFAGLEAKKIFADIEKQREKLEKAQADYADHEERYKVMVEHLKNVRQEVQHTEGLASAKRAEVASEDHLAQMAKREAGRYRQELKREQQELEAIDSTLNALQNQVFGANEKMDGFKLQMNWNQEELEQWALASKQKEEDNLAIEKYTRADEAKINQLALQIEKLTKRDLEIQAQVEAEATETSSRQIELDRTAEEFRVLHAERQKLVQQWKETIEVAARRDQDITKTATEYVQQKQAKEVVDVDLKAAREDLDKVQALHTELQTEVTARERQLQARREFLLSEQERKKKLEEEIDIIKTELVRYGVLTPSYAIDATRFHRTMPRVVSFSSLSCFGPRRGRRGVSEGPRSRRWRLHETAPS